MKEFDPNDRMAELHDEIENKMVEPIKYVPLATENIITIIALFIMIFVTVEAVAGLVDTGGHWFIVLLLGSFSIEWLFISGI